MFGRSEGLPLDEILMFLTFFMRTALGHFLCKSIGWLGVFFRSSCSQLSYWWRDWLSTWAAENNPPKLRSATGKRLHIYEHGLLDVLSAATHSCPELSTIIYLYHFRQFACVAGVSLFLLAGGNLVSHFWCGGYHEWVPSFKNRRSHLWSMTCSIQLPWCDFTCAILRDLKVRLDFCQNPVFDSLRDLEMIGLNFLKTCCRKTGDSR